MSRCLTTASSVTNDTKRQGQAWARAALCSVVRNMKLVAMLVAALASVYVEAAAPCFHYNQDGVELSGTVILKTFFGPPNYGEDPKTDSKERQALLELDHPLCVDASPDGEEKAESQQTLITLVPLGNFSLVPLAGRHVTVSGSLYHAISGHHHTPVLISLEVPPQPVR